MKISSRSHSLLTALVGFWTVLVASEAQSQVIAHTITDNQMYAGMNIVGTVGSTQIVQYSTQLLPTWLTLTNLVLTNSPQFFVDMSSPNQAQRFYRAGPAALLGLSNDVTLLNINDPGSTNGALRGTNGTIISSPTRMGRLTNQFTVPTASIYATDDLYFDVPYDGGGAGAYVVLGDGSGGSMEIASVVSNTHLVVRLHHGTAIPGTVYPAGTNVRQDGGLADTVVTRLVNPFRSPAKGASIAGVLVTSSVTNYVNAYVYIDGYTYLITAAGSAD